MRELHGHVMRYPWGTHDAIPAIVGLPTDGGPVAELWLGAHPLGPSLAGEEPLDRAIEADPTLLGQRCLDAFGPELPFLMKLLSARHALSVQAHPSREQAEDGFAREEAAGIALTSPERTYKDDWPKPEIMVALEEFHTLAGFRDPAESYALFEQLGVIEVLHEVVGPLVGRPGVAGLQEVFLDVLSLGDDRRDVVDQLLAAAVAHRDDPGALGDFARTALELDEAFPSDPGIIVALLMNRVVLGPGEALFVPAGLLHSHLRGTGIEVMANSDNVIRGSLTDKHVAVDELVGIVDFTHCTPEVVTGREVSPGVFVYPAECPEFDVWRLEPRGDARLELPGHGMPRIALVTEGTATFTDAAGPLPMKRGQSIFVPASNSPVTVTGDAQVFVSSPGLR